MRVTNVHNQAIAASNRVRPASHQTAEDTAQSDVSTSSSRALIPLSPAQSSARLQTLARQPANFLAHLIATEQSLPQTRERRRIEPNVGAAIYAAASGSVSTVHASSRDVVYK